MAAANPVGVDSAVKAASKLRAPRNRTLTAKETEIQGLRARLLPVAEVAATNVVGRTILGDCFEAFEALPASFVDLLILDPPYNLTKKFGGTAFSRVSLDEYTEWLRTLFEAVKPLMRPTATIYICGDWFSSASIFAAASEVFEVRNRITWEREKGRGASANWKNASEDVWFCTMSDVYTFNVADVKIRRRVLAPYRDEEGDPKDWLATGRGNFRDTHPSNLWTDITVPFWSMPENTDHPTQKSEKFLAKLILASSDPDAVVFDPFLGSGTSSVVAKKLGRQFCGIELDETFALLAEKRLMLADSDRAIQGYRDGVFWERNTLNTIKSVEERRVLLPFD